MTGWRPDWLPLPPQLKGHDEELVKARYQQECPNGPSWEELEEWKRESWRREVRGV
jgi:hypothetical protein